jgi:hypothetical protein
MVLSTPHMRAGLVAAGSLVVTGVLTRIGLARIWSAGAWREPPAANVFALAAIGLIGLACAGAYWRRPSVFALSLCLAWAALVVGLGSALTLVGHDSALLAMMAAAGSGMAVLVPGARDSGR